MINKPLAQSKQIKTEIVIFKAKRKKLQNISISD